MPPVDTAGRGELARFRLSSDPRSELDFWEEPGVIRVAGSVDACTRRTFTGALLACEIDPCVHALDLSAVDFFSAAGVGCFAEREWHTRPHVLIIASSIVRRVLSMCEMEFLLDQHGWQHT